MRIATWNLRCPRETKPDRSAALQARIREINADVWILTETNQNVSPGDEFASYMSTSIAGLHSPGESRTTVWSRFHVEQQIDTHDPESAVCIEIDSPIGHLVVYGTVFPYQSAGTKGAYRYLGTGVVGKRSGELHYDSISMHENDWLKIRERFPDHSICVAGDLNQSRDGRRWGLGRTPWAGTKKGRDLLSKSLNRAGLVCTTEEDFVESGKLTTRSTVEHLCFDSELAKKVKADAWEAGPFDGKKLSDHNGLHVDIGHDNS